jgi:hypothetical protein
MKHTARQAYGGVEQAKQSHRDERSILWLEQTNWTSGMPAARLHAAPASRLSL